MTSRLQAICFAQLIRFAQQKRVSQQGLPSEILFRTNKD